MYKLDYITTAGSIVYTRLDYHCWIYLYKLDWISTYDLLYKLD